MFCGLPDILPGVGPHNNCPWWLSVKEQTGAYFGRYHLTGKCTCKSKRGLLHRVKSVGHRHGSLRPAHGQNPTVYQLVPSHQRTWKCTRALSKSKVVFLQGPVHFQVSRREGRYLNLYVPTGALVAFVHQGPNRIQRFPEPSSTSHSPQTTLCGCFDPVEHFENLARLGQRSSPKKGNVQN